MIMMMIMTTVAVAYASLSNAARTTETRREQAVIARLAIDGATLKAAYDSGLGTVSYPSTQVEPVGSFSCSVTIADNSVSLSHSLSLSTTLTLLNNTYSDSRIVALKMPQSQFFYCLAINSNTNMSNNVATGASGAKGDVYCDGNLHLRATDTVNGDVESTGNLNQGGATVTGLVSSNVNSIPLPSPNWFNYFSVNSLFLFNPIFGNFIFGETFNTPYEVIYCQGQTSINGTIRGKGIIFVNGNLFVDGDMSYFSANDETSIIVTGNVQINNNVHNIVGYWYCGGGFSTSGNVTLTRGCIVTDWLALSGLFAATYDPTIWNTPGEAKNMKLPGFWP